MQKTSVMYLPLTISEDCVCKAKGKADWRLKKRKLEKKQKNKTRRQRKDERGSERKETEEKKTEINK